MLSTYVIRQLVLLDLNDGRFWSGATHFANALFLGHLVLPAFAWHVLQATFAYPTCLWFGVLF